MLELLLQASASSFLRADSLLQQLLHLLAAVHGALISCCQSSTAHDFSFAHGQSTFLQCYSVTLFKRLISGPVHTEGLLVELYTIPSLKGRYHECVTNIRYAVVSLTTVHWERCFALSERFETSALVTSRMWREGRAVTTYQFSASAS